MNPNCLPGDAAFPEMVGKLAEVLKSRGWRLATAESCTAGWISKCCTDQAASSDWFERGFVTYSNEAKREMLGVSRKALESFGAVSQMVAEQMAEGARISSRVDVALSVTGVAGPGGGSIEKPVGTVWFGWSISGRNTRTDVMRFSGDRDSIRRQSVGYSLGRLIELLDQ